MVLYRLFVLAWAFKCGFSIGGSVSCWQNNCLPCRTFVKNMVWSRNLSDAECNCTNFDPYITMYPVRQLNETSGQCMATRWDEFGLLQTGFRGRNVPYYATNVVVRPARVYVKAKAMCESRAFANYTHGVVRVHGHFGIKLQTKEVQYMINGTWISADYIDGDFFNDAYGSDPFHEFIFDLRLESTAIYYNYRRLVLTDLHASKKVGGIQLDGASGPWINWLTVYDNQCEIQCEIWKCHSDGECTCMDVIPTVAPVEEVEDFTLLCVVLVIMLTNIIVLVCTLCFWRCYGKATRLEEEEGRRSKRASSMYSVRSSYRRSNYQYRASRSDSGMGPGVGLSLQSCNRVKRRRSSRSKERLSRERMSRDDHTLREYDYGESVQEPKEKPKTPDAPPKPKKSVSAKEPQPKQKARSKNQRSKNNRALRHQKQAPAPEAGTVEMVKVKPIKRKKKKKRAKRSKDQVELNHVKQAKKSSKKNPPAVVAHKKRKDSEPKADAQSFSRGPGSVPNLKTSFARSSSSSDVTRMNKDETITSNSTLTSTIVSKQGTASSERDRERPVEAEGYYPSIPGNVKLYE